jgi:hypothetical protein
MKDKHVRERLEANSSGFSNCRSLGGRPCAVRGAPAACDSYLEYRPILNQAEIRAMILLIGGSETYTDRAPASCARSIRTTTGRIGGMIC